MTRNVYVTGVGVVSAIGLGVEQSLKSLKSLKPGMGKLSLFESIHHDLPVCQVKYSNQELISIMDLDQNRQYSRTTLLGLVAVKEAIQTLRLNNDTHNLPTGFISATTVGGMLETEKFYEKFTRDNMKGKLSTVLTHDCADSTEFIADYFGLKNFIATINTACSSSLNSIILGTRLIKNNVLDRVIAGGADSLSKFTLNGFNTLMIIDKEGCKPFDANRQGLTLGEGAGYLVLESEESVETGNRKVLCEVKGYGNACDAYHITASSPEGVGAILSMKKALKTSGLSQNDIDYINAHGTGTENNDLSEGKAILNIFSSGVPYVSSTKAYTGHTLGAAGGIESVFSILSISEQLVFPNLGLNIPMPDLPFQPVTKLVENARVRNVLKNSFGFGGNNSTLIFSRC